MEQNMNQKIEANNEYGKSVNLTSDTTANLLIDMARDLERAITTTSSQQYVREYRGRVDSLIEVFAQHDDNSPESKAVRDVLKLARDAVRYNQSNDQQIETHITTSEMVRRYIMSWALDKRGITIRQTDRTQTEEQLQKSIKYWRKGDTMHGSFTANTIVEYRGHTAKVVTHHDSPDTIFHNSETTLSGDLWIIDDVLMGKILDSHGA